MKHNTFEINLKKLIYIIEMTIAILLAVGVIIGVLDLFKYFNQIFISNPADTYIVFNQMLGYALVLIVAIELILMIVYHSTDAVLELVLYVIARKMLIYANTMLDLVLGTLSIAIIFLIIKFLKLNNDKKDVIRREKEGIYSATIKITDLLHKTGFDIPTDRAITLGGLVCSVADESCITVQEGTELILGDLKIKVIKASDEGLIEEVMVTSNTSNKSKIDYDRHYK